MHTKIVDILQIAVYAPSGENSQPWRFEICKNILYIYNLPKRDNPVYNYRQRGSYIAHGALIQNIKIISPSFGLISEVFLFPNLENKDLIAKVSFRETAIVHSGWEAIIKQRSTNRKKYKNEALDIEILQKLKKSVEDVELCKVLFVEDVERIKKIASCSSVPDRIMLEYKPLHDTIFDNIRWTDFENEEKKTGLFVKTMQLAPPEKIVFSLLRHWAIARFAQFMGLPKFIAQENAKKYATSSLYAVCVVEDIDDGFIYAGMAMQKIWLTAITCGLAAHPLAALPYLYENMSNGGIDDLPDKHVKLLSRAYHELFHICKIKNSEKIAMILRVGKADPVDAISPKLKPDIIIHT